MYLPERIKGRAFCRRGGLSSREGLFVPPNPVKHDDLVCTLRQEITQGAYPPGARLPTREQLELRFRVSSATIQKVFDTLAAEGFVVSEGRRGTYVNNRPPHLCRYGFAFHPTTQSPEWMQFHVAMHHEIIALSQANDLNLEVYTGIGNGAASPDYQRLCEDLSTQRLAGVVFHSPPYRLEESPVVALPGVPRVAFMKTPNIEGIVALDLDMQNWFERAVERLAALQCRRVAILAPPRSTAAETEHLVNALRQEGMVVRPEWVHATCICPANLPEARSLVQLLGSLPQAERPDAFLIMNDNFLEYAASGLVTAGVRVPEEAVVLVHANFPAPPCALAVERLGFDNRAAVLEAIRLIDRQRQGEAVPPRVVLRPLFESELPHSVQVR